MKNLFKPLFLIFFCLIFLLTASQALATTIEIVPEYQEVKVGEIFNVDVKVFEANDLYLYHLGINYDGYFFDAMGITEGDFLKEGGAYATLPSDLSTYPDGPIDYVNQRVGPVPGRSGDGILFTVDFLAQNPGPLCLLDLFIIELCNSVGEIMPGHPDYPNMVADGIVNVHEAPEPGTIFLLATGLLSLLGIERKWRSA